ncbi:MAG: T9SS type A sorting domain-containing protein, partial [Phycisphaerae bacterium]|nr:T9SS type A sorting domain-containing protein [Saprospiraceae bacterium]
GNTTHRTSDYRLIITDMQGKIVLENSFAANEMSELNVRDFPEGMYGISVYSGVGVRTGKFVKIN